MFRDKPIQYPDENPVLGRYLGPAIDVRREMTNKTMKAKGEVGLMVGLIITPVSKYVCIMLWLFIMIHKVCSV